MVRDWMHDYEIDFYNAKVQDILETNKLNIVDEQTILEISTFEARGQSYEASDGNHDDIMMNLVMFGYFVSTQFFADMTDINLKKMLFDQKMKAIEDDMVPFGIIDDGSDYIQQIERQDDPWQITIDTEKAIWDPDL